MNQVVSKENCIATFAEYLAYECGPDEEVGFFEDQGGWVLFSRSGRGYVYGLFQPRNLEEFLVIVLPGTLLENVVKGLTLELADAKRRLSLRNRQIRDLRRQARK